MRFIAFYLHRVEYPRGETLPNPSITLDRVVARRLPSSRRPAPSRWSRLPCGCPIRCVGMLRRGILSRVDFLGEISDFLHSGARLPLIPPAPFSHKGRRGSLGILMPETSEGTQGLPKTLTPVRSFLPSSPTSSRADRTFEQRYVFWRCNGQSALTPAPLPHCGRGANLEQVYCVVMLSEVCIVHMFFSLLNCNGRG